jgi:hypothetical protein
MSCEKLRVARELPANKGKVLICPYEGTCKQNICPFLSDLDQLEVDQKDPKYKERWASNEGIVDKT